MVFQIGYPIRLIGVYLPFETIEVKIYTKEIMEFSCTYILDSIGALDIEISTLKHLNASFDIYITASQATERLINCRFGHVFLAIGQSNMAMPLKYIDERERILEQIDLLADISFLRIDDAHVDNGMVIRPLVESELFYVDNQRFMISNIEKVLEYSAIMVKFAIDHYNKHKLPIQIIDASVGGSSVTAFINMEDIKANSNIYNTLVDSELYPIKQNHYTIPAGIYNEKIYPLRLMKFEGIFWYQGEHHVGGYDAKRFYKESLETLINSYRRLFAQENLLWMNIQLQNHFYAQDKNGIGIVLINEAMQNVSKKLTNVYTIPVHDHFPNWINTYVKSEANPIHPTNKYYIGQRLAAAFNEPQSILEFVNIIFEKEHVLVELNQDIHTQYNDIFGFTIGYSNDILTYANALFINARTIKVFALGVEYPQVITYGFFLYNARCKIYGKHMIPLKPFRFGLFSDDNTYYQPYGFESLTTNKMDQLLPSYLCNQQHSLEIIRQGRFIKNDSIVILQDNLSLIVYGFGCFSLSINLNQNNHPNMFKYFKFVMLTLAEDNELSIDSLIIFTTDQKYYQVKAVRLMYQPKYIFDFKRMTTLELDDKVNVMDVLSKMKEMEFVFELKKSKQIIIEHIRMSNSEVADV